MHEKTSPPKKRHFLNIEESVYLNMDFLRKKKSKELGIPLSWGKFIGILLRENGEGKSGE